jgi:hypothetical protein
MRGRYHHSIVTTGVAAETKWNSRFLNKQFSVHSSQCGKNLFASLAIQEEGRCHGTPGFFENCVRCCCGRRCRHRPGRAAGAATAEHGRKAPRQSGCPSCRHQPKRSRSSPTAGSALGPPLASALASPSLGLAPAALGLAPALAPPPLAPPLLVKAPSYFLSNPDLFSASVPTGKESL